MKRIALVLIARDEARCIERCLASARPWVDEMVVLDTGSLDATPALAHGCGARVESFAWVDDFSAARNAALALTDAPWRLVLDADEWIVSGGDALAALRDEPAEFVGLLSVQSKLDGGGLETLAPSWLPRLLPRGVGYSGRIHEQPAGNAPRRRLALTVAHDGYLAAQRERKHGRNEKLLRLSLAEHPHDAYLHYQLGKDFEVNARFDAALAPYEAALASVHPQAAWRHDLVLRLIFSLKKLRRFEAALQLAEAEMAHWQQSPDFFFALGDLLLDWALAEPARAAELLPMIESCWQRSVDIGERPDLPDTVQGRGSYLAANNLAAFHASLGRSEEARRWREREWQMRCSTSA
jgi:glycosyltransferase involved in cell wall biosynthesis